MVKRLLLVGGLAALALGAIPAGSYRFVVRARDAAGNQAIPRTGPTFTIIFE